MTTEEQRVQRMLQWATVLTFTAVALLIIDYGIKKDILEGTRHAQNTRNHHRTGDPDMVRLGDDTPPRTTTPADDDGPRDTEA